MERKDRGRWWKICLFVGCLTSQQHASVSQGRICTDNFTCCHTEIEAADQTFYLTQSQHSDTRPTSPSADLITPGAWQGSHWSANFWVTGMIRPRKNSGASGIRTLEADALPLGQRGGDGERTGTKTSRRLLWSRLDRSKNETFSTRPVTSYRIPKISWLTIQCPQFL